MKNKIGSTCYRCGGWCHPGEGFFEKTGSAHYKKWPNAKLPKWIVQHVDCADEFSKTSQHYLYNDIRSSSLEEKGRIAGQALRGPLEAH